MKLYLGIDPGITGAYALLDEHGKIVFLGGFETWKSIHIKLSSAASVKNTQIVAYIEEVGAIPNDKNYLRSLTTFLSNYGGWLSLLDILYIPYGKIRANMWQQKILGHFKKGESKEASIKFVKKKYPHLKLKNSQHGLSDAICIALYAIVKDRNG